MYVRIFLIGAVNKSSHCAVAPLSKQKCLQRPPEFTVR